MPIEVVMPRLGWTMETGTVVEWLKASGDVVEAGEMLFSVESDKAITEVEALDSGVLFLPNNAPIGTEVAVGSTVGFILAPGETEPAGIELAGSAAQSSEIMSQHPAVSQQQDSGAPPAPTSAAVVAVSPRARRVAAELGVDLALVTPTGKSGRIREADVRAAAATVVANGSHPRMSPTVKRMAAENGVDVHAIPSTGPAGRVTRSDVLSAAAPSPAPAGGYQSVPMSAFRRAISQRMSDSARSVAPVTLTTEVDATELVRVRDMLKADNPAILPSYNDLLIRLVARALRDYPALNASIDGEQLLLHEVVNIGVAVDTERGLLAPVVRNADRLGVFEIAEESARLIAATRDGSVARESLGGGTFTITNLGMFDIDAFTPIINLPEAAILGVGRIVAKPVVVDESTDEIGVRQMMALSLTFDHRIVDGAPAARFLQSLKQMVERPLRWLM